MNNVSTKTPSGRMFALAAAGALGVVALTSVHHVYGAVVYATPWRLHIAQVGVPAALLIAGLFFAGWTWRGAFVGRVAGWLGVLATLAFPVATIGLFEGGYNHVLKNVTYFAAGEDSARSLFSGDMYEMPSDILFEATGVAQLPAGVLTAVLALRLARALWPRGPASRIARSSRANRGP